MSLNFADGIHLLLHKSSVSTVGIAEGAGWNWLIALMTRLTTSWTSTTTEIRNVGINLEVRMRAIGIIVSDLGVTDGIPISIH